MSRIMFQLALLLAVAATPQGDAQAALAHRQQNYNPAEWGYHYYLTTSPSHPDAQADLATAIKFTVASSTLQPIVEHCTPQEVTPTLFHIDIRDLHWDPKDWRKVLEKYPYNPHTSNPLVVRADWLLLQLSDGRESDAYYRLLFGGSKIPTRRDDWLDLLDVDRNKKDTIGSTAGFDARRYGVIERESGVAMQPARWIERHPISAGYAWGTRDVLKVTFDKDPVENFDGSFIHDGEEWIVGIPKLSLLTGDRGTLQLYILSDGKGNIVQEAPVNLVKDKTLFRGDPIVVNPGSCHQCHNNGINPTHSNDFRDLLASGVVLDIPDRVKREAARAFHLSRLEKEIEQNNELYQTIVPLVTGVTSTETIASYKKSVGRFDDELSLIDVARELGTNPLTLRLALGKAGEDTRARLGARVSGLTQFRTITREAWEEKYGAVLTYLEEWNSNVN